MGIFSKFSDFRLTIIISALGACVVLNSILGLGMTIFSRYTVIFPSEWSTFFNQKEAYILIIILQIILNSIIFIGIVPLTNNSAKNISADAFQENPDLRYFTDEKTFMFVNYHYYAYGTFMSLLGMLLLYSLFCTVASVFIYQLRYNKKSYYINDKLQRSLLVSLISQVLVTLGFLITPYFCFLLFVEFQINNTAVVMTVLLCFVSTHCLLEFLATMYFVTPYRKFLRNFRMNTLYCEWLMG